MVISANAAPLLLFDEPEDARANLSFVPRLRRLNCRRVSQRETSCARRADPCVGIHLDSRLEDDPSRSLRHSQGGPKISSTFRITRWGLWSNVRVGAMWLLVCRADITPRYEAGFRAIFSRVLLNQRPGLAAISRTLSNYRGVTFTCRARISARFNFDFSHRYMKRKFRKNFESHRGGQSDPRSVST